MSDATHARPVDPKAAAERFGRAMSRLRARLDALEAAAARSPHLERAAVVRLDVAADEFAALAALDDAAFTLYDWNFDTRVDPGVTCRVSPEG